LCYENSKVQKAGGWVRCCVSNNNPSTKILEDDIISTPIACFSNGLETVSKGVALKVFLSSLFIQSSFNYHGMQNIGFTFSILPLAKLMGSKRDRIVALLNRHLQLFNTHPYLSGPIIGSVLHMEEMRAVSDTDDGGTAVVNLKNALMGPYAAMGDSFFWGAMKPLAAIFSVVIALQQMLIAPLAFLFLYNPLHIWIRCKGFWEGYRRGKGGVDFVRILDMPQLTRKMRWASLVGLGCLAALAVRLTFPYPLVPHIDIIVKNLYLFLILLCFWGIKRGISQVKMFYCMFIIGWLISF